MIQLRPSDYTVVIIAIDFSKALNTVSHDRQIIQMSKCSAHATLIIWSFLKSTEKAVWSILIGVFPSSFKSIGMNVPISIRLSVQFSSTFICPTISPQHQLYSHTLISDREQIELSASFLKSYIGVPSTPSYGSGQCCHWVSAAK